MKKVYPLLFLLLTLCSWSYAQYNAGQSKVWAFGSNAGINFGSGNPVAFYSAISPVNGGTLEGCASVSDASGNLLFYCTGNRIWGRDGFVMPHGNNMLPAGINTDSSTQGVVITPVPGAANKYYIFSLQQANAIPGAGQCRLYYSVVDMTLHGSYGDVVTGQSGILLDSNLNEAMTTVQGDYCDVWVLVHGLRNHVFKAWHVTNMGISAPVLSNTGNFTGSNAYISGQMKCAPNRRRLVVCTNEYSTAPMSMGAELCDFDPATGNVSNAIVVDTSATHYGIYSAAFSGDNTKLYLHTRSYTSSSNSILQYDLSLPAATIIGSRYVVRLKLHLSDMKLGADSKIYLASDDSSRALDCIAKPGFTGAACMYTQSAVVLQAGTAALAGLPNDFATVNPTDTLHVIKDTVICPAAGSQFVMNAPPNYNTFHWSNGSTADTALFTGPGKYWLVSNTFCDVRVDTFNVTYSKVDTLRNKVVANICAPNNTTLVGPPGYSSYLWYNGSPTSTQVVNTPGTYWLSSVKYCSIRLDTFVMQNTVNLSFTLGNDTTICDPVILSVSLPDVNYRWQDGNRNAQYVADHSGTYFVTVSDKGCSYTDTIHIAYNNIDQDMHDVTVCKDKPIDLDLKANVPKGATAVWNDGSMDAKLHVEQEGKYWVTVSSGACVKSDTVNVSTGLCDCIVLMPDAFTPNADGKNDVFRGIIPPACSFYDYSLVVYNRWGHRVFQSKDPAEGWNGLYKGQQAFADVYMYILEYSAGIKGEKHVQKGDLTLIR